MGFRYEPVRFSAVDRLGFELARKDGRYPPGAAICYVRAAREPVGAVIPCPVSDRIRTIVVESGAARAGAWRLEERDVLADYRHAFGEEPPPLESVALMSDTDQTRSRATAWFQDVELRAAGGQ